jgi:TPR repeat protein
MTTKTILFCLLCCLNTFAGLEAQQRASDKGESKEELLQLAKQGKPGAERQLGFMYAHGIGVPHDYQEALKWYRLAANQGNADAQYNLGVMYENGQGVPGCSCGGRALELCGATGKARQPPPCGGMNPATHYHLPGIWAVREPRS